MFMCKGRSITPNPDADFTPEMGAYKELKPFRFWCQKVLPLVYDDSLSYYELLCKVVNYLNVTMEDFETLNGDVVGLHDAYVKLQEYVNNYFNGLDVQEEINNKLDNMASSGELYEIIRRYTDPMINEQNDKIDVLKARMDTFSSLPTGSTSGDAELTDIRVGYDGITYPSAGDSVRKQIRMLNSDLAYLKDSTYNTKSISGNILNIKDSAYHKINNIVIVPEDSSITSVEIFLSKKNLYNKDDSTMTKQAMLDQSNNWYKGDGTSRSIVLRCNPNTTYTISHNYEQNKAFLKCGTLSHEPNFNDVVDDFVYKGNTNVLTVTTASNAKYLIVQFPYTGFDSYIKQTIQVEVGTTNTYFETYECQTATIDIETRTGFEELRFYSGVNNIYSKTDCVMVCEYYTEKNLNTVYPKLTETEKNEIVSLCNDYLQNTPLFVYNGGVIMDIYSSSENAIKDGKFNVNCGLFAQLIWMGRSINDFDVDNYSPNITKVFDWGHYFEFALRKRANNVVKKSNRDETSFYGFTKPNNDNYEDSYSFNTYYGGATWNSAGQYYRSYAYASDMAHELFNMGCEIPRSELDLGDLVFYRGADDKSMSIGTRLNFRTISHVAVVVDTNYKKSGYIRVIEATFQNSDNPYTIAESSVACDNNYDALRACFYEERIVMCARHPHAFNRNRQVPTTIENIN